MVTYFNKKDLVSFGNYLLSDERGRSFKATEHIHPDSIHQRLSNVHHADIENWKELQKQPKKAKTKRSLEGQAKMISTMDIDIHPGRAVGNTTRQVNYAVEKLLAGHDVQAKDHATIGNKRAQDGELFDKIHYRLYHEHQQCYEKLNFDRKSFIITHFH